MPPAEVVERDGIDLGGFQMRLLEKTEELTLYTLDRADSDNRLATFPIAHDNSRDRFVNREFIFMTLSLVVYIVALAATPNETPLVAFTPHPSGFVTSWLLAGPFPNPPHGQGRHPGLVKDHLGGEADVRAIEGEGDPPWTLHLSRSEIIELDGPFETSVDVVAYAYATIISPAGMDAMIQLGGTDGMRVWHNGTRVFDRRTMPRLRIDAAATAIRLEQGVNSVLVKIAQSSGPWRFVLRITDQAEQIIPGLYPAIRTSRNREQLAELLQSCLRLTVSPDPITHQNQASLLLHAPPSWPAGLGALRLGFGIETAGGPFRSLLIRNLTPGDPPAEAAWNTSDLPVGRHTALVKVQDDLGRPIAELRTECEKIQTHPVRVILRDHETSVPVGARVSLVDDQGRFWLPEGRKDVVVDNHPFAYVGGSFTVNVPDGPIDLRVHRGPEYVPLHETWTETSAGETRIIRLKRWINMNARSWYSGDTHVHNLTPKTALHEARGEDLNVVNLLLQSMGLSVVPSEHFTGKPVTTHGWPHVVAVGQELPYDGLGDISFLNLPTLIEPVDGKFPPLAELVDRAAARNGCVIGSRLESSDVKVALDAVDILGSGDPTGTLNNYYQLLNRGHKLAATAGTDKQQGDKIVGGVRTYAHIEGRFDHAGWIDAVRRGSTFVTTGPMLFFKVIAGKTTYSPGQTIKLDKPGSVRIQAVVEAREPIVRLEIVGRGQVIQTAESTDQGRRTKIAFDVPVAESTWLAARCFSPKPASLTAHTSPIYVEVAESAGFESIFDGKSLSGWKAYDMSYWSIVDGAITAKITDEHPCKINQYLVWQGGELDDFELRLTFRMVSASKVNGGFQFRSKLLPNHDVAGYQVDNDTHDSWLVRLYDEHGRHTLAFRGQRAEITPDGKITHGEIPGATGKPGFRLDQWHTYHLIARGPRLILEVNDRLMAEVNDGDVKQQDFSGILALQLHSGPPMTVQFKDIQLKRLQPATQ